MTKQDAIKLAQSKYAERAEVLEYVGTINARHIFGMIDKDRGNTIDAPFYIAIDERGTIAEYEEMPFLQSASAETEFVQLEKQFKFYERHGIYDE